MAMGTAKTLLCAALIRRFLKTRNAERVLFIVDRIELAKQTMEDFNIILGDYRPVIIPLSPVTPTARVRLSNGRPAALENLAPRQCNAD